MGFLLGLNEIMLQHRAWHLCVSRKRYLLFRVTDLRRLSLKTGTCGETAVKTNLIPLSLSDTTRGVSIFVPPTVLNRLHPFPIRFLQRLGVLGVISKTRNRRLKGDRAPVRNLFGSPIRRMGTRGPFTHASLWDANTAAHAPSLSMFSERLRVYGVSSYPGRGGRDSRREKEGEHAHELPRQSWVTASSLRRSVDDVSPVNSVALVRSRFGGCVDLTEELPPPSPPPPPEGLV